MGWFDWCCCRKSESLPDDRAIICETSPSRTNSDASSVSEDSKMGQTISQVTKYFRPERPVAASESNDVIDSAEIHSSTEEPLLNRSHEPLATPRSPLRRSIGSITPPDTPKLPPAKRLKGDVQYMNYPMLMEEATIEYVQRNKLMVILKGLPGSGKSTIAENLKKVYPDAVLCSADYFFMVDGEYKFDFEKLQEAHQSCQDCARHAAQRNCNVIVIDNTNVRHWEYQVYLEISREYNYVAVILEPQTPWCFKAAELGVRNSHGVNEKIIAKKLKSYQQALPIYYGWFLNGADSQMISRIARQWLERALIEVEDFFQDFSNFPQLYKLKSHEEMMKYHHRENDILHVTSKFTGRGKPSGTMEYIDNPVVKNAIGRCYPIHVIGYVITPRTFGARVQLTEKELQLWASNDYESPPDNISRGGGNRNDIHPPSNDSEIVDSENVEVAVDLCHPRVVVTPQELGDKRFCPTYGKGSRAHLTLGCSYGVKPVTTGFDMIDAVSCEQELIKQTVTEDNNDMDTDFANQDVATYNISGAVLKCYGEGRWVIYPETKAVAESLFSAFY